MSDDIVTMYENNIKQHFGDYVELFINVEFQLNDQIAMTKASSELSLKLKKTEINKTYSISL